MMSWASPPHCVPASAGWGIYCLQLIGLAMTVNFKVPTEPKLTPSREPVKQSPVHIAILFFHCHWLQVPKSWFPKCSSRATHARITSYHLEEGRAGGVALHPIDADRRTKRCTSRGTHANVSLLEPCKGKAAPENLNQVKEHFLMGKEKLPQSWKEKEHSNDGKCRGL